MNNTLNICLSCGLCCDGTLIGFVQLDKEEMPALREIMEIEAERDNGFFLLPCKKYCNGCTIYTERSNQCAGFNCALLKSFENNELDYDSAVGIIALVKQKRSDIEAKIEALHFELQSPSFYFKIVEVKKLLKKIKLESSSNSDYFKLMADIDVLDNVLIKSFGISAY